MCILSCHFPVCDISGFMEAAWFCFSRNFLTGLLWLDALTFRSSEHRHSNGSLDIALTPEPSPFPSATNGAHLHAVRRNGVIPFHVSKDRLTSPDPMAEQVGDRSLSGRVCT